MEKATSTRKYGVWIRLPENRAACAAIEAVAARRTRRRVINPLFLHGPTGTGKSHLVETLVVLYGLDHKGAPISVTPAGDLDGRDADDSAPARKQADLVVVEDVQKLPPSAVETLVGLVDHCLARHKQIVLTATVGPGLLNLPVRLTSRLAQGLVVALEALSPDSRREVLRIYDHLLDTDIRDWLAQHTSGSFRQLDGAMARFRGLQKALQRPPTLPDVIKAFFDDTEARRITLERVAQRVSRHYRVETRTMRSRSRSREALLPRQVGMYLARQLTGFSLEEIGDYFGGRDHSTVLHACRKVEHMMNHDSYFTGMVRQLSAEIAS